MNELHQEVISPARERRHLALAMAVVIAGSSVLGIEASIRHERYSQPVPAQAAEPNYAQHQTGTVEAFERCVRMHGDRWLVCAYTWRPR